MTEDKLVRALVVGSLVVFGLLATAWVIGVVGTILALVTTGCCA